MPTAAATTTATVPVRVSTALVDLARQEAKIFRRSVAGQLEYWATLGRAFEAMPRSTVPRLRETLDGSSMAIDATDSTRVRDALLGNLPVEFLDEGEQATFYDLVGLMGPSDASTVFCAALRKAGGGVGLDDQGNMVQRLPDGRLVPCGGGT